MKKIVSLIMSLIVLTATFSLVGCNADERKKIEDPNTLRILVWEGGYGREWANTLGRGFEALYPDKTVDVNFTASDAKITVEALADPKDNKFDIIFSNNELTRDAYTDYTIPGVEHAFAEISDVMDANKAKMFDGVYDYMSSQNGGLNYIFPALTTVTGIVYNKEVFKDCGLTRTPRTTEELFEFCDIIKDKGYVPFIFAGDTDYYTPTTLDWWLQYQGWEQFSHYFEGKAEIDGDLLYSTDIFRQNGTLYSLQTMEKLIGQNDKYTDGNCTAYLFMDAQHHFITKNEKTGKYKYAMMTNGAWLENEMREFVKPGDTPLDIMTTPLISDIVYADRAKTKQAQEPVTDDTTLRQIVSYVRGEISEKPLGVSDDFIERVRDAVVRCRSDLGFNGVIPSASKKQDLAKDFLKYMYTDDAIERVALVNSGCYIPVNYDYSKVDGLFDKLTQVQKTAVGFLDGAYKKSYLLRSHPIVYVGGLPQITNTSLYAAFAASNPDDRKSAETIYNNTINYYESGNTWENLLRQAGVI